MVVARTCLLFLVGVKGPPSSCFTHVTILSAYDQNWQHALLIFMFCTPQKYLLSILICVRPAMSAIGFLRHFEVPNLEANFPDLWYHVYLDKQESFAIWNRLLRSSWSTKIINLYTTLKNAPKSMNSHVASRLGAFNDPTNTCQAYSSSIAY